MSRSYRKQPVWKDHNRGMKTIANRKVRRALNRDIDFELPNSLYKRYFCQYDICDYCSLVSRSFEQFYQSRVRDWKERRHYWFWKDQPYPTRKEVYKDWLSYRGK